MSPPDSHAGFYLLPFGEKSCRGPPEKLNAHE